ncbi:hypothetical protein ANN_24263 [Periplaneta americana]|uniref:Uncharacterized protein n=1 Tax=Periplaneta americana TaxID=6978 RepID=A0ABQ8S2L2_PERAM|nr:hypothetical protein ANN_24263 [Periplaneta americana]
MAGLCEGCNEPPSSLKAISTGWFHRGFCPKTGLNLTSDNKKPPLMRQLDQEIMWKGLELRVTGAYQVTLLLMGARYYRRLRQDDPPISFGFTMLIRAPGAYQAARQRMVPGSIRS